MNRFIGFIHQSLLSILFAAALNLSFHVSMPDQYIAFMSTGTEIQEQSYSFVPFGERESSSPIQPVCKLPTFTHSTYTEQWTPLQPGKITLELFYRQNFTVFKEYPFVVQVRKLRI